MKIITRAALAATVPDKWAEQYRTGARPDQVAITHELAGLTAPIDPDLVDRIIGNNSWTKVPECSDCGMSHSDVVEVGQEPDYESYTAYLCADCVSAAAKLFSEAA